MRNVWLLLKAFMAGWKNRRNIGFLIVLIVIMISTICYVREQERTSAEKISLGLVKEDTSEYADLLLQYFNENEVFLSYVELIEESEQKLKQSLSLGELDAYLVIPKDFSQSMISMENLPVRAMVSMQNPTKALVLRYVMEAYETYIEAVEVNCNALYRRMKEEGFSPTELEAANVEISLELIFTALGKDELFRHRVLDAEKQISLAEHYKWTIVYFLLLLLFLPAGLKVIDVKQRGLYSRMKAMRISSIQLLTAVGLPYLFTAVFLLCGYSCWNGTGSRLLQGLVFLLPWLLIFLLLGLLCKSSRDYLFICSMVLVTMAVLGGSLIPEQFLPDAFRKLAEWLPNRNFTYVMGGGML